MEITKQLLPIKERKYWSNQIEKRTTSQLLEMLGTIENNLYEREVKLLVSAKIIERTIKTEKSLTF